jgi:nickase
MVNKVSLQKIKSEIETRREELEKYEKKIVQLKNMEKQINKIRYSCLGRRQAFCDA